MGERGKPAIEEDQKEPKPPSPEEVTKQLEEVKSQARAYEEYTSQTVPEPEYYQQPPLSGKVQDLATAARYATQDQYLMSIVKALSQSENPMNTLVTYAIITDLMDRMEMRRMQRMQVQQVPEWARKLEERLSKLERMILEREREREEKTKYDMLREYIDSKFNELREKIARSEAPTQAKDLLISKLDDLKNTMTKLIEERREDRIAQAIEELKKIVEKSPGTPVSVEEMLDRIANVIEKVKRITGESEKRPYYTTTSIEPLKYRGEAPYWAHPDFLRGVIEPVFEKIEKLVGTALALKEGIPLISKEESKSSTELPEELKI